MPRYFITTTNHDTVTDNHDTVTDEEGTEVADLPALRILLRHALTDILHDAGERAGANAFSADAYDASGRHVMSARVDFALTEP